MKLNRKNNKKGFTIVELVIVIAVIGILSAILIPTFTNLTQDARNAADKEEVNNTYTQYVMDAAQTGSYLSQTQVAVTKDRDNGPWYVYENNAWTKKTSKPANIAANEDPTYPTTATDGWKVYNIAA